MASSKYRGNDGSYSPKMIKHGHRNTGKANKVPRSATFSGKKGPVADHSTWSGMSKKKDKGY